MISLLFLTYNRRGIQARCFRSLAPTLHRDDVEWVILDNASRDGSAEWLLKMAARYANVQIELSAVNLGVAGGRKRLLELAAGDMLVFLDSDVEARQSDWLDRLLAPLQDRTVGLVGAMGHFIEGPQWKTRRVDPAYAGRVDVLSGYCQAFRRDLLGRGVAVDTGFNYGGAEDDDFCFQVAAQGLQVVQQPVGLHHVFSGTWNTRLYPQMRARLKTKWQGKGVIQRA